MTLGELLTSVANAIRNKKGTTDKINAANFASEIASITTGSVGGAVASITRQDNHPGLGTFGSATSSSSIDRVLIGSRYTEVLTPVDSWAFRDHATLCTVIMNGVDITSQSYTYVSRKCMIVSIQEVTGDISITVWTETD